MRVTWDIVRGLDTIICAVSLTLIQFSFSMFTPVTNLAEVTVQWIGNCNFTLLESTTAIKLSWVIGLTDKLILQYGMSSEVHRRNNNGLQTLPSSNFNTMKSSLLQQLSTITCCDGFDRICVSTDNTEPKNTHRAEVIKNSYSFHSITFFFVCSFLNSCGCSTAKSMTSPQETFFSPT